jgi:hypothetical protein
MLSDEDMERQSVEEVMERDFHRSLAELRAAAGINKSKQPARGAVIAALAKGAQTGSLSMGMRQAIAWALDKRKPLSDEMLKALGLYDDGTLRKSHRAEEGLGVVRLRDASDAVEQALGVRRAGRGLGVQSGADQSGHAPGGGGSLFNIERSAPRDDVVREESDELSADVRHMRDDGRYEYYSTRLGKLVQVTRADILRYVSEAVQSGRLDLQTASIVEQRLNGRRALPDAMLRYICEG